MKKSNSLVKIQFLVLALLASCRTDTPPAQAACSDCISLQDEGVIKNLADLGYTLSKNQIAREVLNSVDTLNFNPVVPVKSYADLAHFPNLVQLKIYDFGSLDTLSFSANTKLRDLAIVRAPGRTIRSSIRVLKIDQLTDLKKLRLSYMIDFMGGDTDTQFSKIESLDLSKNVNLTNLGLLGFRMGKLGFSGLAHLQHLELYQVFDAPEVLSLISNSALGSLHIIQSPEIKAVCVHAAVNAGDLGPHDGIAVTTCEK